MAEAYEFEFDPRKNAALKKEREISFEEIIMLISEGHLIDVVEHPNQTKYPRRNLYIVDVEGYVYLVPFERRGYRIILKTIYPSRKATREYGKKREEVR